MESPNRAQNYGPEYRVLIPCAYKSIGRLDAHTLDSFGKKYYRYHEDKVFHLLYVLDKNDKWGIYDLNSTTGNPWLVPCEYENGNIEITGHNLIRLIKGNKMGGLIRVTVNGRDFWKQIPFEYAGIAPVKGSQTYLAVKPEEKTWSTYSPAGNLLFSDFDAVRGAKGNHLMVQKDGKLSIYKNQGSYNYKEILSGVELVENFTLHEEENPIFRDNDLPYGLEEEVLRKRGYLPESYDDIYASILKNKEGKLGLYYYELDSLLIPFTASRIEYPKTPPSRNLYERDRCMQVVTPTTTYWLDRLSLWFKVKDTIVATKEPMYDIIAARGIEGWDEDKLYWGKKLESDKSYDYLLNGEGKVVYRGVSNTDFRLGSYHPDVIEIKKNGKYGIVSLKTGKVIAPPIYDETNISVENVGSRERIMLSQKAGNGDWFTIFDIPTGKLVIKKFIPASANAYVKRDFLRQYLSK